MKKLFLLLSISFLSYNGISQKLEFDFIASSLDEAILDDYQFIKSHFLGNEIARKVKLLDLGRLWASSKNSHLPDLKLGRLD